MLARSTAPPFAQSTVEKLTVADSDSSGESVWPGSACEARKKPLLRSTPKPRRSENEMVTFGVNEAFRPRAGTPMSMLIGFSDSVKVFPILNWNSAAAALKMLTLPVPEPVQLFPDRSHARVWSAFSSTNWMSGELDPVKPSGSRLPMDGRFFSVSTAMETTLSTTPFRSRLFSRMKFASGCR